MKSGGDDVHQFRQATPVIPVYPGTVQTDVWYKVLFYSQMS